MRLLIATDAWHPQINGVVRTLSAVTRSLRQLGVETLFLTPEGFPTIPVPSYPGLRCALPSPREVARKIGAMRPDAIHIATEGPIGYVVRGYCLSQCRPFTTSFTTRFPDYISARAPVPKAFGYAMLRRFHRPAKVTMVSTLSLMAELEAMGFGHLGLWTRGVDTEMFHPRQAADLNFPRPIFLTAGRIAVEKNLEAFLSLDLPGTKLVVGAGPQEAKLRALYPATQFLGVREFDQLAAVMAAADVFVFPSRTDTYGIVQLEALACGLPVAAFPVTGPKDVIGEREIGVLDEDLGSACMRALGLSREACRAFAVTQSWEASARQFLSHVERAVASPAFRGAA